MSDKSQGNRNNRDNPHEYKNSGNTTDIIALAYYCAMIEEHDAELEEKYTQMSALYGMTPDQLKQSLPVERLTHDLRLARARAIVVDSAKPI